MKYEKEPCKGKCGCHFIENRTYWLCRECNYFRIHGKTRLEAHKEKNNGSGAKRYVIGRKFVKRSNLLKKGINKKRNIALEKDREFYKHIFDTRPNICEECGRPLPDVFEDYNGNIVYIQQYSHILSKKAYPEHRHNKMNMNRLCGECHYEWEFGDRVSMNIYKGNQLIIEKMLNKIY